MEEFDPKHYMIQDAFSDRLEDFFDLSRLNIVYYWGNNESWQRREYIAFETKDTPVKIYFSVSQLYGTCEICCPCLSLSEDTEYDAYRDRLLLEARSSVTTNKKDIDIEYEQWILRRKYSPWDPSMFVTS
jgi:hypothetical protein